MSFKIGILFGPKEVAYKNYYTPFSFLRKWKEKEMRMEPDKPWQERNDTTVMEYTRYILHL
jgi:hypothetical protein